MSSVNEQHEAVAAWSMFTSPSVHFETVTTTAPKSSDAVLIDMPPSPPASQICHAPRPLSPSQAGCMGATRNRVRDVTRWLPVSRTAICIGVLAGSAGLSGWGAAKLGGPAALGCLITLSAVLSYFTLGMTVMRPIGSITSAARREREYVNSLMSADPTRRREIEAAVRPFAAGDLCGYTGRYMGELPSDASRKVYFRGLRGADALTRPLGQELHMLRLLARLKHDTRQVVANCVDLTDAAAVEILEIVIAANDASLLARVGEAAARWSPCFGDLLLSVLRQPPVQRDKWLEFLAELQKETFSQRPEAVGEHFPFHAIRTRFRARLDALYRVAASLLARPDGRELRDTILRADWGEYLDDGEFDAAALSRIITDVCREPFHQLCDWFEEPSQDELKDPRVAARRKDQVEAFRAFADRPDAGRLIGVIRNIVFSCSKDDRKAIARTSIKLEDSAIEALGRICQGVPVGRRAAVVQYLAQHPLDTWETLKNTVPVLSLLALPQTARPKVLDFLSISEQQQSLPALLGFVFSQDRRQDHKEIIQALWTARLERFKRRRDAALERQGLLDE